MQYFTQFLILVGIGSLFSCSHKNTPEQTQEFADQLTSDNFTLTGDYHWNFQLMGGTQHSIHTFYPDSITYVMEGKVYSATYTMKKLAFDQSQNKWIGQDGDGIVYVLFFKDKTDTSITLYKHKCSTNGLQEALDFEIPTPNATEDHGWNIYTLSEEDTEDMLSLSGNYVYKDTSLMVFDSLVIFNGKQFHKLSYHAGERRWVGQTNDSTFLQLFFKELAPVDSLSISVMEFTDWEKAYQTKYHTVNFAKYVKQ